MLHELFICKENYCLNIIFTLFQLISADNDLRHFISAPWTFPKVNSLRLHLVATIIFSNFKIQSKYNSDFHQKGEISSIRKLFLWFHWDWWITCNAWVAPFCILCWECSSLINDLYIVIKPCSNFLCYWVHWSCLCHLANSEEKKISELPSYNFSGVHQHHQLGCHGDHHVHHQMYGIMSTIFRRIIWTSIFICTISS